MRLATITAIVVLSLLPAACGGAYDDQLIVIRPPNTAVPPMGAQPQGNSAIPSISGDATRSCPLTAYNC